jgi:hypothetical protein
MLGVMKSALATKDKASVEVYNWLITEAGLDMLEYAKASVSLAWPEESEEKDLVLHLFAAASTFVKKADRDKDRKQAGAELGKKVSKFVRGRGEEAGEALLEAAELLTSPRYVKSRGFDEGVAASKYGRYGWARSGTAYSAPAAAQPAAAAPAAYVPPGFQLVPCAQAVATPLGGAGGGAAARPKVGKAALDPTKVYPPAHFARPCMYCQYPAHSGDGCWKTFPELRPLNS